MGYNDLSECTLTQDERVAEKEAMEKASPAPPKLTRSQRRYRAFLDADLDILFREYMKLEATR